MGSKRSFLVEEINYLHLQSKNHTWTRGLMDIASDYGSEGWGFDSLRVHLSNTNKTQSRSESISERLFHYRPSKKLQTIPLAR